MQLSWEIVMGAAHGHTLSGSAGRTQHARLSPSLRPHPAPPPAQPETQTSLPVWDVGRSRGLGSPSCSPLGYAVSLLRIKEGVTLLSPRS